MRRLAGSFVVSLLVIWGCQPASVRPVTTDGPIEGNRVVVSSGDSKTTADVTFDRILEIASSGAADAKTELERVEEESPDAQLRMLARRILSRWSEESNAYRSDVPQTLEVTCIDTDELKKVMPGDVEASRLYVEVSVDAAGRPVRASVVKSDHDQVVTNAVVASLMRKRFVPARVNDRYIESALTIECRLEVR